ncbi:ATP-binding protein [Emticicia sp. SJ17W-69]|uniref:ATP-binding protein n=1 Tax=Emticicia sp. SJ17W-69 TaxID=3421657 RepID=UPI003EBE1E6B
MILRIKFLMLSLFITVSALCQNKDEKKYILYKAKFDSLSKLPQSFGNDTLRLMALDSIMESSVKMKSKDLYDVYKKIAYESKWKKGIARYKVFYANSDLFHRNVPEATRLFIEADRELEAIGDYQMQIYALMRLSMLITHKSDSLSAQKYINKAILIAKNHNDQKWLIKTLNYKANTFVFRNRLDLALPIFEEIEKFKDLPLYERIINDLNLGTCYMYTNRVEKGMRYQLNALKMIPKNELIGLQQDVRFEIINFYLNNKDFKSAKKYYLQLTNFYNEYKPYIEISKRYYEFGYKIEKGLKNLSLALFYLEQKSIYQDSVAIEAKTNTEEGLKSQLELNEQKVKSQQVELSKLKTEQSKQSQLRWFLVLLSVIGVIVSVYILKTNRTLKKNNQDLISKNKEISEALLKGQTIERQRVALDLHDNLGSTLSALWLNVDMIDKSKMNDEEKEIHQNLRENLEKAYNDVRLLSHNLLPEEFEKQGLVPTLQGFVRKISKNAKIHFDLHIAEDFGRVDNKIEFELYSICLELVNNIIKHSKATEAKISLSRTEKQIELIVSDNGIGTFKNESDGKGMKNIKARVESLNGVWNLQNIENQGVINEVLIPV